MRARPSRSQGDRDALEDLGLAELDDRAGSGESAKHNEELMPS